MEQKHTPAPWYHIEYSGYNQLHDGDHYGATNLLDEDECSAASYNGKLAAAAPDLLEALQGILKLCYAALPIEETSVKAIAKAKQAIDKATSN